MKYNFQYYPIHELQKYNMNEFITEGLINFILYTFNYEIKDVIVINPTSYLHILYIQNILVLTKRKQNKLYYYVDNLQSINKKMKDYENIVISSISNHGSAFLTYKIAD